MDKKTVKVLKPKQRLRSRSFCELNLRFVSKLSYRDTADMLNRVLHRDEDWVESYGESLSDGYMSKAEEILDSYNVDKQSGIIAKEASLPLPILSPELPAIIEEKQARHLITEYNRGRDTVWRS